MSEYVYAGLTSQTIDLFIRDSSSTTGQGLAGLVYNSGSLVASYRKGATGTRTAITLATQTVGGAWSSGGFVEIDATNMKGTYRLDLPNAAVDTEGFVTVFLSGAANMVPVALRIDCRPLPVNVKQAAGVAWESGAITAAAIAASALNGKGDWLLSSGYTAPANSTIASIYALLQLTDSDVASIVALLGTPAGASIAADLAAIKLSADAALRPIVAGRQLAVAATTGAVALDPAVEATINDIPNTAEFQARTLAAASYATASQINSLQVNTRASVQVPVEIETPDSGTQIWKIRLFLFDSDGNMEAPDSTPTVALVNASGTDRSSRLSAATTLSTGAYSWDYTSTDDDAEEQINWTFTVVEGGLTRIYPATSYVVEETAYRFTSTDRSTLNSRASSTEVTTVGTAVTAVSTKLGTPAGASVSADIASVKTDTGTTIPGLFTTLTTKIRKFFQLVLRKDSAIATDNATELTEINASGGSGSGSYVSTTDSQQAIRDQGDSAWGGGGGGAESALLLSTTIDTVTSQTVFTLVDGSPNNDVYNDHMAILTDAVTSTQKAKAQVLDYVASTKTLTLAAAPGFTIASGDSIAIVAVQGLTAAQNARLSLLGAGTRQTVKADSGASIELKIGDDYVAAIDTAKRIEINDVDASIYDAIRTESHTARSFGFGYIKAGAKSSDVVTGTIDRSTVTYTAASGSVKAYTTVFVEMSVASTLAAGCGKYDIQVTHSNGKKQTLFSGDCELVTDYKS